MKKITFILIYLLSGITGIAQDVTEPIDILQEVAMQLANDNDNVYHGSLQHKSPARMPRVAYDLQYIYITPYYDIADAQIIIRDETDNIIYDIYTSLTGTGSVIMPSKEVMENKYCIEIIFSGKSYIGYF